MNKQLWTRLATEHNLAAPERPAVKEPEKSESEEYVPKLKLPAILWQWTDYRIVAHEYLK